MYSIKRSGTQNPLKAKNVAMYILNSIIVDFDHSRHGVTQSLTHIHTQTAVSYFEGECRDGERWKYPVYLIKQSGK